jgi:PAS domain S-box-containing protein
MGADEPAPEWDDRVGESLPRRVGGLPGVFWECDLAGRRAWISPNWRELTGQDVAAALGLGWIGVVHADDRSIVVGQVRQAGEQARDFRLGYRVRDPGGEFRNVIDSAEPRFSRSGELLGFLGTTMEVTGQDRTDPVVAIARARQQESVAALWRASLSGAGRDAIFHAAVRSVAQGLEAEHVEICGAGAHGGQLELSVGRGWLRGLCDARVLMGCLAPQVSLTVLAGEPIIVPDLAREMRFGVPRRLLEFGAAAALSVPIRGRSGSTGVLVLYTRRPREFSHDDVAFARSIANVLAEATRLEISMSGVPPTGGSEGEVLERAESHVSYEV